MVTLVALLPISWYAGLRTMNMSRVESLLVALMLYLVGSQQQNGFELNATLKEGMVPLLWSQIMFPFTSICSSYLCLFSYNNLFSFKFKASLRNLIEYNIMKN